MLRAFRLLFDLWLGVLMNTGKLWILQQLTVLSAGKT
ncbi:hypothetical protein SAMN05444000_1632 [Shimia gijangensis]|uniref:Uncharacterized protein n=1 Tax=Shimia gijangensis TaxID=1470563 RepID=A0A1M6UCE0_9RHOB|nr:hypothetical protein SAMN05444000_1632 [Shimia gijangensis]